MSKLTIEEIIDLRYSELRDDTVKLYSRAGELADLCITQAERIKKLEAQVAIRPVMTGMHFDADAAVAELLNNHVLDVNSRDYMWDGKVEARTLVLFVDCNDVFGRGADAEPLDYSEVKVLYELWEKDKVWGPAKFCALKRNCRPMESVEMKMKECGVWDYMLESMRCGA